MFPTDFGELKRSAGGRVVCHKCLFLLLFILLFFPLFSFFMLCSREGSTGQSVLGLQHELPTAAVPWGCCCLSMGHPWLQSLLPRAALSHISSAVCPASYSWHRHFEISFKPAWGCLCWFQRHLEPAVAISGLTHKAPLQP